jgi:hypothetical protein
MLLCKNRNRSHKRLRHDQKKTNPTPNPSPSQGSKAPERPYLGNGGQVRLREVRRGGAFNSASLGVVAAAWEGEVRGLKVFCEVGVGV